MHDDHFGIAPWFMVLGALAMFLFLSRGAMGQDEDLFLESFDTSVTYPISEEEVNLNATAFTDTNVTTNVTVTVFDRLDGEEIELIIYNITLHYVDLGGINVDFDYAWSVDRAGTHYLRFEIDPQNNHTETNESNNNLSATLIVSAEPTPELTFRDLDPMTTTPDSPLTNLTAQMVFSIVNEGHDSASQFGVRFSQSYEGGGFSQVEVRYYPDLDTGQAIIDAFNWTPDRVGLYTLRLVVDMDDDVDEIVEDNNLYEIEVEVRRHLPELGWLEGTQIVLESTDEWLELPFTNHTLSLSAYVKNTDVEVDAREVEIEVWDTPEGASVPNLVGRIFLVQVLAQTTQNVEPTLATIDWLPANGSAIAGTHLISMVIDPDGRQQEYDLDNNMLNTTVFVHSSKVDVLPVGVFVSNETDNHPAEGIYSQINVSLANLGALNIQNLRMDILDNGEPIETYYVALTQGATENFTVNVFWRSNGWRNIKVVLDNEELIPELDEDNNELEVLVFVGLRHVDFAITYIDHPGEVFEGQTYTAAVSLYNLASRVTQLEVQFFIDEVLLERRIINSLDNAQNKTLTYSWVVNSAVGVHNLTVEARNENQSLISDEDLSNNAYQTNFTVKGNLYQLLIFPFSFKEKLILNETAELTFTVVNLGEQAVEKVNVSVRIDDKLKEIVLIGPVPPNGGELDFTIQWNPQTTGEHQVALFVDSDDQIDEYDETDNHRSSMVQVKQERVELVSTPGTQSILDNASLWLALLGLLVVVALAVVFAYKLRQQQALVRPGIKPQTGAPITISTLKVDADSAICLECLRPVEKHAEAVNCACGKVYHTRCSTRAGRCHSCGESLW